MASLEGKTVVVTGAASGMGEQHARKMAQMGANIVLTDIQADKGHAVAQDIGKAALFLKHDVSSGAQWAEVMRRTVDRFGPVAGLVNNAALGGYSFWDDVTEELFMKFIRINALSVMLGMRAVVPYMKQIGGGSIVNISSTAGSKGTAGALCYTASKFAVTGMTKAAAVDLGQFNIRVNSVHPGAIETPMLRASLGLDETARLDTGSLSHSRIPLGRIGRTDEVSNMVALLISDESGFCTGGEYFVDGGQCCQD